MMGCLSVLAEWLTLARMCAASAVAFRGLARRIEAGRDTIPPKQPQISSHPIRATSGVWRPCLLGRKALEALSARSMIGTCPLRPAHTHHSHPVGVCLVCVSVCVVADVPPFMCSSSKQFLQKLSLQLVQ